MEKSCLPWELLVWGVQSAQNNTNGLDNFAGIVDNGNCLFERGRHNGQRCSRSRAEDIGYNVMSEGGDQLSLYVFGLQCLWNANDETEKTKGAELYLLSSIAILTATKGQVPSTNRPGLS